MQAFKQTPPNCCGCHLSPLCVENVCVKSDSYLSKLPIKRRFNVKKHDALFTPGTPFQYLFAIEDGAIKTVQIEADGSELIRGFYFSGEVMGYKAIATGCYQSTAKALCDSQICMIEYRDFLYFLQEHPELQHHIIYLVSLQMNIGSYLVTNSAERKFAAFLIDLASRLHRANIKYDLVLPMSRQDIGNYLRLTPETISRVLTRFTQSDLIRVDNKNITILKPDLMRKIADSTSS